MIYASRESHASCFSEILVNPELKLSVVHLNQILKDWTNHYKLVRACSILHIQGITLCKREKGLLQKKLDYTMY